jgi:glycosyltransferase involved in cell wall biosynthesis
MEEKLSVVVLTHNEENNVEDCLRSVAWADELIVLDSFSDDRTVEIAQENGARVVQHAFENWAIQRDYGLTLPANRWLFYVDADERGTPDLAEEVRRVIQQDSPVGWWVPRRNYIWGKWIRHAGWYPDYQLRLLRRDKARYDPTREVHEIVILDGEEGFLENTLTHYNYDTVGEFLSKQDFYSNYEAGILFKQGVRPRLRTFVAQPVREFWRRFISLKGYRDGVHGLALSALLGYYTLLTYVRLWDLRRGATRTAAGGRALDESGRDTPLT